MKGTPMTKEQITQAMHLYGKGMSGRKIALEMGLSHASVHKTISSNSIHITSKSKQEKQKKAPAKSAKVVTSKTAGYSFTPFHVPDDAPICNATVMSSEPYRCPELSYRQPSRA